MIVEEHKALLESKQLKLEQQEKLIQLYKELSVNPIGNQENGEQDNITKPKPGKSKEVEQDFSLE